MSGRRPVMYEVTYRLGAIGLSELSACPHRAVRSARALADRGHSVWIRDLDGALHRVAAFVELLRARSAGPTPLEILKAVRSG